MQLETDFNRYAKRHSDIFHELFVLSVQQALSEKIEDVKILRQIRQLTPKTTLRELSDIVTQAGIRLFT